MLANSDPAVRLAVLKHMQREKVPASLEALGKWLKKDSDPERITAVLDFLRDEPAADVQQHLEPVVRSPSHTAANRLAALALFVNGISKAHADALLALCEGLEDGPVLAEALRLLSKYPTPSAAPLLARKLGSPKPEVRAAAIGRWANFGPMRVGSRSSGCSRSRSWVRRAAGHGKNSSGRRFSRC
jgi:hypothetical protein